MFLENPLARSPCSSTPAELLASDHYNAAARSPRREQRGLLHWDFRGSIAWLSDWLSTLHLAMQDSLAAAGQALPCGIRPAGFR